MARPVIGIATQTLPGVSGERPDCWIMGQNYVAALRDAGAVPWLIPLMPDDPETMQEIYDRLDGVFLTGGVDVDPVRYGERKLPLCGTTDPHRDEIEWQLIRHANEKNIPILAVCRGVQILNVAMGGTLYQDISAQAPGTMRHDYFPNEYNTNRAYLAHEVTVYPQSRLGKILGETVVPVNSMHHQAIKKLAEGLVPNALAPDGIIEGVEGTNGQFLVGVQWHPEELVHTQPGMKRLFKSFTESALIRRFYSELN